MKAFWITITLCLTSSILFAQRVRVEVALAPNIMVPQSRIASMDTRGAVRIASVRASVVIRGQRAETTVDIRLQNPAAQQQEAVVLLPVPQDAVIRGFDFHGAGMEPSAVLLRREEATRIYQEIVRKVRDPALLEFAGCHLIRSSVFPVPANGQQQLRIIYESLLADESGRIDYVLPRSEALDFNVPWEIDVQIHSAHPIATIYSPSHELAVSREGEQRAGIVVSGAAAMEPGPFLLSYLRQRPDGLFATLFAYPDPEVGGGYFLLLAGAPEVERQVQQRGKREVTLVLDRSGSMRGEKLDQAKAAAIQVIQGLEADEAFNIIDYSDSIASFAPRPVAATSESIDNARSYIRRLHPAGGTNIHDALVEALRPAPQADRLPIVLFLTDGLPTIGVLNEARIRESIGKGNAHGHRLFTIGVGYDVNAPLLSYLARGSRGSSTFVLPKENVESKVSRLYERLWGPVLLAPELALVDAEGAITTRRVRELQPGLLPDLFEGDQLVVLGQYVGDEPLDFRLTGSLQGTARRFSFRFDLGEATTRNSFVPRLWASRKIASLIEAIRQDAAGRTGELLPPSASDPRHKELIDEIVRLSLRFGIMTEYTAFLAREGTELIANEFNRGNAGTNLQNRSSIRSGKGGVNQMLNDGYQQRQIHENRRNSYLDSNMEQQQESRVQQMNDRALFQRGNRWVDPRTVDQAGASQVDQRIAFGSDEHIALVQKLLRENRQGTLSLKGEILLRVDDQNILIH